MRVTGGRRSKKVTEESNASDRLAEKGDQETEELKERNKEMVTDLDRRGGGG